MSDDKKLSLSGRGTLGLGKGVEKGKVRQSFSHGRSKAVVVERRRKRLVKKDMPGQEPAEEAKQDESTAFKPKRSEDESAGHLTKDELQARAEALRHAEEDRRRQVEEEERRRKAEEEERRRKAEEEAMREAAGEVEDEEAPVGVVDEGQESEEERLKAAEEEARILAEETAKRQAQEKARRKAEAEERKRLAEEEERQKAEEEEAKRKKEADDKETVKYGFDSTKKRALEEERAREEKKQAAKTARRDEPRRRAGKLTIAKALEEDGDQQGRKRSLAAYRRAQAKKKAAKQASDGGAQARKVREVTIPEVITVQELANRMAEKAAAVIKSLMKMDVMATINDNLDQDTAELIVEEFGHKPKRVSESDVEIGLTGDDDTDETKESRPPVVTVMGHVDHGKTSLLDALRATDVAAGEAGGITQHIGAYQVRLKGGERITFIDTPGHAAFTEMRARGASVTDLVILVVAADDGVMPQTVEAINHAKAAGVPIIVAINKIDVAGANPDNIRQELLQHEVVVESMGGDVLDVEVSALKKQGLDKLEETILLQSELLELKANPNRPAEGVIVEAKLEKGRGPVATVLIKRGTLKVGDIFVAGAEWGRARALMDEREQQLDEAGPSRPVEVLGLQGAPSAGDDFAVVENEARAREVSEYRQAQLRRKRQGGSPSSLETMFSAMKENKALEFPVLVKADVQGSVEAIVSALEKIGNEDIQARVLHAAVGGVTETDVTLAKASDALIIGFNVRANKQAREAAEQDNVQIKYYSVIYDLVDEVRAAMAGELAPEIRENTIGTAEVREVFSAGKTGKAAGCLVVDGVIRAKAKARLLRDDVVVYDGEISSLRRFRDEASEVSAGTECGISFERFSDIKAGDVVECYELEEHERVL